MILEAKEYFIENEQNFYLSSNPTYDWLPFHSVNILDFKP